MNKAVLFITVFISGAAVLALEILGTRILGPFYGVSLFLWSALITVTLAALSIGYAIGGRWADKEPKFERLAYLLAGAGVWHLIIPWLKYPVLSLLEPAGLRVAVLTASFILFFPPLTLLGMISPYAIKLNTQNMDEVGRSAGNLYAVSTVASVFSALLTGFWLIPNIGVTRLTVMVGGILLLTAASLMFFKKLYRTAVASLTTLALFASLFFMSFDGETAAPEKGLLAVEQSPYAEIRVLDENNYRYLLIDGGTHTIVKTQSWESYFPYVAVMEIPKLFYEKAGEMLLIGLGGGSIVKNYARDGWAVEAVEIDPVVVDVANKYFGLQASEGKIHTMDGRQFLLGTEKKYDVIIMDAFGSSSIPFHLTTQESFGLIAAHLRENGVFAINLESKGWFEAIVESLGATLKQHFEYELVLPITTRADMLGNIVLLASNTEFPLLKELRHDYNDPNYPGTMEYWKILAWDYKFVPETDGLPILTDDLNPVDIWAEQTNLAARKVLHEYFRESGLSW